MKNFSTSIQRKKRGKRTEYIARLTYYDKTGKRKGVSKSAATHSDAKRELQDLIDQHMAGGPEVLEARNMTFAALAEHCKGTRYCEAFYDEQDRKLYGVREPKKFASMINRLVSSLGHLKLSDITVSHLQQYRRKRLSTKTNRGTYTDVATVNRELSTCRAMLNDAVVNDWLVRSPFVKAKKGELIAVAHEAKRQVVQNFSPTGKYDLPTTDAIFRPLFDDLFECAKSSGLLPIRQVELVTSTSISPTPLSLPTNATHQLFIGPGTSAFCNYWAKVYTAIVKAIATEGDGRKRITSPVDLKDCLSHDVSGLLLAMRLSIYYAATGTVLGFGDVAQPSQYAGYRIDLLRAMEVFALAHEYSHFLLHERSLQVADEEGNESNIGLEFLCDAIGLQLSRVWGSKNDSWLAFTGAGAIAFFRAYETSVNCATKLAGLRSYAPRRKPDDSHPSPRERALTLIKWAVEKTDRDQREAVETFLVEFDLICSTTGEFVLDSLRSEVEATC